MASWRCSVLSAGVSKVSPKRSRISSSARPADRNGILAIAARSTLRTCPPSARSSWLDPLRATAGSWPSRSAWPASRAERQRANERPLARLTCVCTQAGSAIERLLNRFATNSSAAACESPCSRRNRSATAVSASRASRSPRARMVKASPSVRTGRTSSCSMRQWRPAWASLADSGNRSRWNSVPPPPSRPSRRRHRLACRSQPSRAISMFMPRLVVGRPGSSPAAARAANSAAVNQTFIGRPSTSPRPSASSWRGPFHAPRSDAARSATGNGWAPRRGRTGRRRNRAGRGNRWR